MTTDSLLHSADLWYINHFEGVQNGTVEVVRHSFGAVDDIDILEVTEEIEFALRSLRGPYDVIWTPLGPGGRSLFQKGLLRPLTDVWDSEKLWTRMRPQISEWVNDGGGIPFSIPTVLLPSTLYLRRGTLDDNGFGMPQTLEEIMSICNILLANNKIRCCFGLEDAGGFQRHIWFDNLNIQMHGVDFHTNFTDGRVPFTDSRIWATLSYLGDLVDHKMLCNATVSDFYYGDSLGYVFLGFVHATSTTHPAADVADVIPMFFPPISNLDTGSPDVLVASMMGLSVPQNSDFRETASLDFVREFTNPEILAPFLLATPWGMPYDQYVHPFSTHSMRNKVQLLVDTASAIVHVSRDAMAGRELQQSWHIGIGDWMYSPVMRHTRQLNWTREVEAIRLDELYGTASQPQMFPPPGEYSATVVVSLTSYTRQADVLYAVSSGNNGPPAPFTFYDDALRLSNLEPGAPPMRFTVSALSRRADLTDSEIVTHVYIVTSVSDSGSDVLPGLNIAALVSLVVIATLSVAFLVTFALVCMWRRMRKRSTVVHLASDNQVVVQPSELSNMDLIATGSYGEVFKATWRGTRVCVKQSRMQARNAKGAVTREAWHKIVDDFVTEASILVRIRHPNVLTMMGVCVVPCLTIITEYMARGSLYDVLHDRRKNPTLPLAVRLAWLRQMAKGMMFLHASNPPILHRDFKSLNVLIGTNWVAKIADFGMSSFFHSPTQESATGYRDGSTWDTTRSRSHSRSRTTLPTASGNIHRSRSGHSMQDPQLLNSGRRIGTLWWASPEVIRDPNNYTTASDVYSYGMTVWEVCTRARLYDRMSPHAVAQGVITGMRPDIKRVSGPFRILHPLIRECWSGKPADRPSFQDIVSKLEVTEDMETQSIAPPTELSPVAPDAACVFLCVSLEPVLLKCLTLMPCVYSMYVRGLMASVEGILRIHEGCVVHSSVYDFILGFDAPAEALEVANHLMGTYVAPVMPDAPTCSHDHTQRDYPAVRLPLAMCLSHSSWVGTLKHGWHSQDAIASATVDTISSSLPTVRQDVLLPVPIAGSFFIMPNAQADASSFMFPDQVNGTHTVRVHGLAEEVVNVEWFSTHTLSSFLALFRHQTRSSTGARTPRSNMQRLIRASSSVVSPSEDAAGLNRVDTGSRHHSRAGSSVSCGGSIVSDHEMPGSLAILRLSSSPSATSSSISLSSSPTSSSPSLPSPSPLPVGPTVIPAAASAGGSTSPAVIVSPSSPEVQAVPQHTREARPGASPPSLSDQHEEDASSASSSGEGACQRERRQTVSERPRRSFSGSSSSVDHEIIYSSPVVSTTTTLTGTGEEDSSSLSSPRSEQHNSHSLSLNLLQRGGSGDSLSQLHTARMQPWLIPCQTVEKVMGQHNLFFSRGSLWTSHCMETPLTRSPRPLETRRLLRVLSAQPHNFDQMLSFTETVTRVLKLKHEHLLRIHGVCLVPHNMGIITDQADYNLKTALRDVGLSRSQRMRIALQIFSGFACLEANNMHFGGALTLENILLWDKGERVALADYHFAPLRRFFGTMAVSHPVRFVAPEVLGGGEPDIRNDVYAAAVIVTELLNDGRPCFPRGMDPFDISGFVMGGGSPQLPPSLPPWIRQILETCFRVDPDMRPSFEELHALWRAGMRENRVSSGSQLLTPYSNDATEHAAPVDIATRQRNLRKHRTRAQLGGESSTGATAKAVAHSK